MAWASGELGLTLRAPGGLPIDPDVAAGDPDLDYLRPAAGGPLVAGYTFTSTVPGAYVAVIRDVAQPAAGADWALVAVAFALIGLLAFGLASRLRRHLD